MMDSKSIEALRLKFSEEATDHIADLENALLKLEKDPEDAEHIERTFRAMHSLKGGGAMFGFNKITELTHNLETIYDLIRAGKAKLTETILNITFDSVDFLKILITSDNNAPEVEERQKELLEDISQLIGLTKQQPVNNNITENTVSSAPALTTYYIFFKPNSEIFDNGTNPLYLIDELSSMGEFKAYARFNLLPSLEAINPEKCYTHWEMFLVTSDPISMIHDVFMFVEDECELEITQVLPDNLLSDGQYSDILGLLEASKEDIGIDRIKAAILESSPKNLKKKEQSTLKNGKENAISSIRVASEKLDDLMNLVSELVTMQARLNLYSEKENTAELNLISENVQKLTRQLRDLAFSIVLIPVEHMLTRFHRLVRDLSKDLNKNIDFKTEGAETELDKNIIEGLTDPLMHMIRNSIDHGIEDPATRKKLGKPEKGQIKLKAYYSGASVHIRLTDDGYGINAARVKAKAIEKGLITPETELSKKEIFELVFLPGFSTADEVTDVSGRGVGMDVVKRRISDIRGEIDIDSEEGKGTTITIKLPLTLSIIDGLLVKIQNTHYIIPLSSIMKIHAVNHNDVVNKFNNLIVLDDEQIPFYCLRSEFEVEENTEKVEQVVIVSYEENKVGIVVDHIVGEYQAVLKPLGKHYKDQDMISGATILGDGTVALVLDTNKMISNITKIKFQTTEY